MATDIQALTEKEKQTLRLMVRGHDAKSLAKHLNLSVHTVNERLRDARRKLQVSSSREAARRLLDAESHDPKNLADMRIGEGDLCTRMRKEPAAGASQRGRRRFFGVIAGVIVMSSLSGIVAASVLSGQGAQFAATSPPPPGPVATVSESDAIRAGRDWLALGDEGRWRDGWLASASSFRKVNSAARWAEVASQARLPLGAVVSRTALSQESVPAPPAGIEVVKFRTSFTNKTNVIETLTLVREEGAWRVAGCMIG